MPLMGQAQGCWHPGAGRSPGNPTQTHTEKAGGKLMDEGILSIRWETGSMDIRMDAFFPCEQARFKKLLKLINLDWEHCDTLKETLKVNFQERIPELKIQRVQVYRELSNVRQAVADLERLIKSSKKPNGVHLTKGELQQAKQDLKAAKDRRMDLDRAFRKATSDIPKLEKLLEIINKNIGGT